MTEQRSESEGNNSHIVANSRSIVISIVCYINKLGLHLICAAFTPGWNWGVNRCRSLD